MSPSQSSTRWWRARGSCGRSSAADRGPGGPCLRTRWPTPSARGRFCYVVELVASGAPARGQAPRGGLAAGARARRRRREHHELRRRGDGPRPDAGRHRGAGPRAHAQRPRHVRRPGPRGPPQDAGGPPGARDRERLRPHRRLAESPPGRPARRAAGLRPRLGPPGPDDRRAAPGRPALPRRRGGLPVQVRGGGLRLAVRRSSRRRSPPAPTARSRRWAGTPRSSASSSATSTSAGSGPRCSATCTSSARGPPSGWRGASRPAAGCPRRSSRPCAQEARGKDGGLRARLERAARTVAVLRGLGYAGAYLGGTHDADHVAWIIRRARELAPRWEELAAELRYGYEGGFYLYGPRVPERDPRRGARARRPRAHPGLEAARGPDGRRGAGAAVDRARARRPRPPLPGHDATPCCGGLSRTPRGLGRPTAGRRSAPSSALELAVKRPLFGCQACGNCVLGHLEYVCPETCPKHLRNGPCGGTYLGHCEVVDQPCIWVGVDARASAAGRARRARDLRARRPIARSRAPAPGSTTSSTATAVLELRRVPAPRRRPPRDRARGGLRWSPPPERSCTSTPTERGPGPRRPARRASSGAPPAPGRTPLAGRGPQPARPRTRGRTCSRGRAAFMRASARSTASRTSASTSASNRACSASSTTPFAWR